MFPTIIYLSGLLLSVVLILILAHYEKQRGENIDDLPATISMSLLSWITVILFYLAYRDTYHTIIKEWFKKN